MFVMALMAYLSLISYHPLFDTHETMITTKWTGWAAAMGSNAEAVAIYRMALGVMLLVELTTRFQYLHPFYSDQG